MADDNKKVKEARKDKDVEEFLKLAQKRFKKCKDNENINFSAALEDLRFLNGDQWDMGEKQRRKNRGRPCLQINVLPKYTKQVQGEMRKNKIQIKVHPVDNKADVQLAKIREGIIYNIEYLSNAEGIYDHAGTMLVNCGYGAWRICTRYIEDDENPFLQEIYLERILNPFTVHIDPAAKDTNFEDAEYAFIETKMSKDDFEEEFGEKFVPGSGLTDSPSIGTSSEHWWDKDTVTVAEYFYKEYEEKKMCFLSDGQSLEEDKAKEFIEGAKRAFKSVANQKPKGELTGGGITQSNPGEVPITKTPETETPEVPGGEVEEPKPDESTTGTDTLGAPTILKTRTVRIPHIKWAKITANKILDEEDWAGKYIPIILVTGEETNIEGKRYIHGLIRDAKDPQRMLNFWHTSAAETVALAPKAPWLATAKMVEGYEQDYLNANEDNNPVLLYNIDPSSPQSLPTRTGPGQAPMAIFTEIGRAEQNIKSAIGMYNADVGDTSNEQLRDVSGKAITARQMPGDIATFIYPDKMSQAVAYCGRIINDLIPYIYDTERDARLRNVDSTESFVPINTTTGKALSTMQANPQKYTNMDINKLKASIKANGEYASYNDITSGKYDIVCSTGPTFATQRIEAADAMLKLAMARNMNPIDKYFYLLNCDFPGAAEYAQVVRRMIPPNILPPDKEHPFIPPPVPPKEKVNLAKTQVEMAKQKTEQIKLQVELTKLQKEIGETNGEIRKQVLDVQAELNAPFHPADEEFDQQQQTQQQQAQPIQGGLNG